MPSLIMKSIGISEFPSTFHLFQRFVWRNPAALRNICFSDADQLGKESSEFLWAPARHVQQLNELQIDERLAFCLKMLGMPKSPGRICFSDESRVVLGSGRRLVWYRRGGAT
jgi:hypothetical protein